MTPASPPNTKTKTKTQKTTKPAATKRPPRTPRVPSRRAPTSAPALAPKRRIERDALYSYADLRLLTGLGERTLYAILRTARDQSQAGVGARRKYLVTGAEFLHLRAAYCGYADVA